MEDSRKILNQYWMFITEYTNKNEDPCVDFHGQDVSFSVMVDRPIEESQQIIVDELNKRKDNFKLFPTGFDCAKALCERVKLLETGHSTVTNSYCFNILFDGEKFWLPTPEDDYMMDEAWYGKSK